jgi:hypothetical protein
MSLISDKIKKFWTEHEFKVVLLAGFLLIAAVSFESGYLKGKAAENSPIVIENPVQSQNLSQDSAQGNSLEAQKSAQEAKKMETPPIISVQNLPRDRQNCALIGSKNSNKYHLPTCASAKQIKPENIVCFSSADDAVSKGYQPAASCFK